MILFEVGSRESVIPTDDRNNMIWIIGPISILSINDRIGTGKVHVRFPCGPCFLIQLQKFFKWFTEVFGMDDLHQCLTVQVFDIIQIFIKFKIRTHHDHIVSEIVQRHVFECGIFRCGRIRFIGDAYHAAVQKFGFDHFCGFRAVPVISILIPVCRAGKQISVLQFGIAHEAHIFGKRPVSFCIQCAFCISVGDQFFCQRTDTGCED